jgi:hypothetical protein
MELIVSGRGMGGEWVQFPDFEGKPPAVPRTIPAWISTGHGHGSSRCGGVGLSVYEYVRRSS